MSEEQVQIYDLMACNVYMDFDTQLPKEQHKFLIAFHPTGDRPVPELIESITAKGPNGTRLRWPIRNLRPAISTAGYTIAQPIPIGIW